MQFLGNTRVKGIEEVDDKLRIAMEGSTEHVTVDLVVLATG
jgi:pyruvate/2-oxoglutarate dehydrogenase complex dihydrolipoamide dehydrogenase (E3) component